MKRRTFLQCGTALAASALLPALPASSEPVLIGIDPAGEPDMMGIFIYRPGAAVEFFAFQNRLRERFHAAIGLPREFIEPALHVAASRAASDEASTRSLRAGQTS